MGFYFWEHQLCPQQVTQWQISNERERSASPPPGSQQTKQRRSPVRAHLLRTPERPGGPRCCPAPPARGLSGRPLARPALPSASPRQPGLRGSIPPAARPLPRRPPCPGDLCHLRHRAHPEHLRNRGSPGKRARSSSRPVVPGVQHPATSFASSPRSGPRCAPPPPATAHLRTRGAQPPPPSSADKWLPVPVRRLRPAGNFRLRARPASPRGWPRPLRAWPHPEAGLGGAAPSRVEKAAASPGWVPGLAGAGCSRLKTIPVWSFGGCSLRGFRMVPGKELGFRFSVLCLSAFHSAET